MDGTRTESESEDRPATTSAGARVSSSFAPSRAGVVEVWRDVGSTATSSLSVALERGGVTWGVGRVWRVKGAAAGGSGVGLRDGVGCSGLKMVYWYESLESL